MRCFAAVLPVSVFVLCVLQYVFLQYVSACVSLALAGTVLFLKIQTFGNILTFRCILKIRMHSKNPEEEKVWVKR